MAWNKLSRSSSVSFSSQSEDKIPPWLQHGNTVTPCYRSLWNISLHYVGRSRKQQILATSHFETSHHTMWGGVGNTTNPCYKSLWNISPHYVGRSRKHNDHLIQVTLKRLTTLCGKEEKTQLLATSHFETSHCTMWGGGENTTTCCYKSLWNVSLHYVGRRRKHNDPLLQVTLKRLVALCGKEHTTVLLCVLAVHSTYFRIPFQSQRNCN